MYMTALRVSIFVTEVVSGILEQSPNLIKSAVITAWRAVLLMPKFQKSWVRAHNLRLAPIYEYLLFKRVYYVLGLLLIFEVPLPMPWFVCVCMYVHACVL